MGAQESKPPLEYDSALSVFSPEEQDHIKTIFDTICGEHVSTTAGQTQGTTGFDSAQLQAYASELPQRLAYHLFTYMLSVVPSSDQRPQVVNYYYFVVALSHVLKGTSTERARLIGSLASGGSGQVTTTHLIRLIEDLMEAYRNTVQNQEEFTTWKLAQHHTSMVGFTNILLQGLAPQDTSDKDGDVTYDEAALEKWTSSCALLLHILDTVFQPCFSFVTGAASETEDNLVPQAVGAPWGKFSTLLDLPSLVLLTNALPPHCLSPWRLLFSDSVHGESFSTMVKQVTQKGPCVLLVRDSEGHVFGGFTGTDLAPKPQFAGDETSFLFSLSPTMQVYNTTTYNTNYLYLNRGQETMPNGLGMGGQFDYFGLWLDADYGRGHSRAQPTCTTYNSPQLSASPNFKVDHLEVWGVGTDPAVLRKLKEETPPEPPKVRLADLINSKSLVMSTALKWKMTAKAKTQVYTEQKNRIFSFLQLSMDSEDQPPSILDKDPGAKALLEMINKPQVSEGLREADPTADIPEQKELHPVN